MEAFEYQIRKDIRNNPIVREVDEARARELWHSVLVGGVFVVLLLYAAWQHFELIRYGYRDRARELAERVVSLLARDVESSGGMHENYDAETGRALWAENFGSWDLLAARMIEEAETGHDPARITHQSRSQ